MFYQYSKENSIAVPEPFKRYMTPLFMADDPVITESNFSLHITEWEPGCKIDLHDHPDAMEAMYCMSGEGRVQINGEEHLFTPGSLIVAPPTVTHMIENTGDEMLRVFCVFSPPITGEDLRKRAFAAIEKA